MTCNQKKLITKQEATPLAHNVLMFKIAGVSNLNGGMKPLDT